MEDHLPLEVHLRRDPGVLAEEVFPGFIFFRAGRHNDDAVGDLLGFAVRSSHGS